MLKGISLSSVRELLEDNTDREMEEIQKLWERMGDKEYRKKVESLMRKGFEYSTIKKAVENL